MRANSFRMEFASAFRSVVEPFVTWLHTLEFRAKWSTTLEPSDHAGVEGRMHLRAFMGFSKSVDWAGLGAVAFNGFNVQLACGRGAHFKT